MTIQSDRERSFIETLVNAVPSWALGGIGTLLTLALVLKIIGVDFAGPINGISAAYTEAIQAQARGIEDFTAATVRMEGLINEQRKSINELHTSITKELVAQRNEIDSNRDAISELYEAVIANKARIESLENDH